MKKDHTLEPYEDSQFDFKKEKRLENRFWNEETNNMGKGKITDKRHKINKGKKNSLFSHLTGQDS